MPLEVSFPLGMEAVGACVGQRRWVVAVRRSGRKLDRPLSLQLAGGDPHGDFAAMDHDRGRPGERQPDFVPVNGRDTNSQRFAADRHVDLLANPSCQNQRRCLFRFHLLMTVEQRAASRVAIVPCRRHLQRGVEALDELE